MIVLLTLVLLLQNLQSFSFAFPSKDWKASIAEIRERAAAPITSPDDSNELIGDLLSPGPTSPVGEVR
jgi:hypothetical protein